MVARVISPSESFGRYSLIGFLGQGGMGQLHLAILPSSDGRGRVCVLKRLLPHLAASADFRDMFTQEAKILARLIHPNILQVHEVGQVGEQYFAAMEYLPGEDLTAVLARARATGGLPVEIAARIALDVASGLHYAHEILADDGRPANLVHRDVNPSNVMLTYGGGVKVLDFGIAKARTSQVQTQAGTFKGKVSYAAPEQLTGEPLDRRTDVFGLGLLLWESLTGHVLFDGASQAARLEAVRTRIIPSPSALRADVPQRLSAITLRALERDRGRRFQSAQEMAQELREFLTDYRPGTDAGVLAQYIEQVFGSPRATVKKAIGANENVVDNLARLEAMEVSASNRPASSARTSAPKVAWSTDAAGGASFRPALAVTPPSGSQIPAASYGGPGSQTISGISSISLPLVPPDLEPRPWGRRSLALLVTLGAGMLVAAALLLMPAAEVQPTSVPVAELRVDSDPPGAQVFLGGEPTGRTTPTRLEGLPVGNQLLVRVTKAGHESIERRVVIEAGGLDLKVSLAAAVGKLRLVDLPRGARLYIDGGSVEPRDILELPIGRHKVRIEAGSQLLVERSIDVGDGEAVFSLSKEAP